MGGRGWPPGGSDGGRSQYGPGVTQPSAPAPAALPPPDVSSIFELEPHGPDTYLGETPPYPWGRIFGGLVIAQALWAATQTVDPAHSVHSLHAYFILGGETTEPVRYEVDRIRNGRSFTTRLVVARQSGGAILNLACSFQKHEPGVETQTATLPGDVPPLDPALVITEGSGIERLDVAQPPGSPRAVTWARYPHPLGDDPRLHACARSAYLSDANAMDAVAASHPRGIPPGEQWDSTYMTASLDHAVWFQRPARADDWLLFVMEGHGIIRTRGVATGAVFTSAGQHVASIAQEGLIREVAQP